MGNARWSSQQFQDFTHRYTAGRRAEDVFDARGPRAEFDPRCFRSAKAATAR